MMCGIGILPVQLTGWKSATARPRFSGPVPHQIDPLRLYLPRALRFRSAYGWRIPR